MAPKKRKKKPMKKPVASGPASTLLGVDPRELYRDKATARLLIAMAVAYNDIRGALQLSDIAKSPPDAPLALRGERAGMNYQATRALGSVLHELLVLLSKERATIGTPAFQRLVARLPRPEPYAAWAELVAAAEGKGADAGDAKLLLMLRNNLGFHYSTKVFGKAYEAAFLAAGAPPLRSRAVYVDGNSMEGTRFMFADAVMEQGLVTVLELPLPDLLKAIERVATNANLALRYLLVGYLRADSGGVAPFTPDLSEHK